MKEELKVSIDFTKYKGKYVALVDKKIVTSSENAKIVLEKAKLKYPKKEVVLRKIPEEETLILAVKSNCRCDDISYTKQTSSSST